MFILLLFCVYICFSSLVCYTKIFYVLALSEISHLLNTGLDSETLAVCVRLCEQGVNPEALAIVIKELQKEVAKVKAEV